jgi:hypothetical protein
VGNKKFDPLWELVGEKVVLQGQEPDIDAHCPHCNVNLHVGSDFPDGSLVSCGLCGGASLVSWRDGRVTLQVLPEAHAE